MQKHILIEHFGATQPGPVAATAPSRPLGEKPNRQTLGRSPPGRRPPPRQAAASLARTCRAPGAVAAHWKHVGGTS